MVSTSSRIADASSVAATPVGGRPTRTPASMSSLDWPYRYRPTSSRSGRSITSRSCADPTEPVAHWMTLIIATTQVVRAGPRSCLQDDAAGVGQDAAGDEELAADTAMTDVLADT